MLTPPSPSTAVIRARAPGSSGISTCQTATPERTVGFAARPSRALLGRARRSPRRAAASASAIWSRSGCSRARRTDRSPRRPGRDWRSRIVAPQRGLRRGQPREVAEPARGQQAGCPARPPPRCAARPHQRRRGDLREMADDRDEPVVALRVSHDGPSAERDSIHARTASVAAGSVSGVGRQRPRRSRRGRRRTRARARSARCRPSGDPARTAPPRSPGAEPPDVADHAAP